MDDYKRNEYEMKAEYLHRKMKTKAKQINKLKAIQQYKVYFLFLSWCLILRVFIDVVVVV